jgi:hypothetical protein
MVAMDTREVLEIIKNTGSPLKRQLLMVGLISQPLEAEIFVLHFLDLSL